MRLGIKVLTVPILLLFSHSVAELLRSGADAWAHKNSNGKSAYAHAQDLAKSGSAEGKAVLRAFSDVYDMGGGDPSDGTKPPRWKPDDSVTECTACQVHTLESWSCWLLISLSLTRSRLPWSGGSITAGRVGAFFAPNVRPVQPRFSNLIF